MVTFTLRVRRNGGQPPLLQFRIRQNLVQAPTEDFKLITKTAQTRHPLLNIKETDLFHIEITTI
ncbi:hypothetical protein AD936_16430 [Gluconobacter japonicus]|nr:hypothetical protein AD935_09000 [Gluconobacter japonicus]KXV31678.1 hypothetical protein AD936_16430 [Gluconobacter japonicus]